MLNNLTNKAISAAIHAQWQEAIACNLEILEKNPNHVPTLNRLAKAYFEIGDYQQSHAYYQTVLELDKYNSIALKNIDLLNHHQTPSEKTHVTINLNFIEEPGKTKTLSLTRLGDPKVLAGLIPGQIVNLTLKNHAICVCSDTQDHIGALTDDVAYTLKRAMEMGNKYQATIKAVSTNKVTLFIREIFRDDRLRDSPTFIHNSVI